jgi:hypothetical protein
VTIRTFELPVPGEAWAIISPQTKLPIMSSIRSTRWACLLCWWRGHRLTKRGFDKAGYTVKRVTVTLAD